MADPISKSLIYKADQDKRDYFRITSPHTQDIEPVLPITCTNFRFPVSSRTYLGRLAEPLTMLINRIVEVHNELVIDEKLTDMASYQWQRYHHYNYNLLKSETTKVFLDLELFLRKKSLQGGTPMGRTEKFLHNVYMPVFNTFSTTPSILNEFNSNMVNSCAGWQFGDFQQFPIDDPFFKHHQTFDAIRYSLIISGHLDEMQTAENTLHPSIRNRLIDDIYEMRMYFFKGWDPTKHVFQFSDDLHFQLDLQAPVVRLNIFANGQKSHRYGCFESIEINNQIYTASMYRAAFWLGEVFIDPFLWIIHDYLVGLFSRSSIGAARGINTPIDYEYKPYFIDADDDDLEVKDLNAIDQVFRESKSTGKIFSAINFTHFKGLMTSHFNCRFSSGKGSEVKIQREGSRIMTLGRHKKDPEISTIKIKETLKRLEIPVDDFLIAFKTQK